MSKHACCNNQVGIQMHGIWASAVWSHRLFIVQFDVQRELGWVLDDAVDAVQRSADETWQQTSWGALQPELHGPGAAATRNLRVRLREDLPALQVRAAAAHRARTCRTPLVM